MPSKSAPAGDEPYWGPITANYDWYARARHPQMLGETPRGRCRGCRLRTFDGAAPSNANGFASCRHRPPTRPPTLRAGARETTR